MIIRTKRRLTFFFLTVFILTVSVIAYPRIVQNVPWLYAPLAKLSVNLGLDLQGGIHLEYAMDLTGLTDGNGDGSVLDERAKALDAVQAVVERRVNAFGVGEPVVQRMTAGDEERLVVELPGLKDIEAAKSLIKETPFLEFREDVSDEPESQEFIAAVNEAAKNQSVDGEEVRELTITDFPDMRWKPSGLTGAHLRGADFDPGSSHSGVAEPSVLLRFNDEGTELFAEITRGHIGEQFAIFLDDEVISAPVIQAEITNGEAVITGNFTPEEAKNLAGRLNEGALPVPITLVAQQSVDASLGTAALSAGLKAGAFGLMLTMLYMIFYYRFFGLVAAVALVVYAATVVTVFKLSGFLPGGMAITLTLSGIAGFILSVGMAVDANILIFERIKEERKRGKTLKSAVSVGFERAWTSIRDGNISTLLICIILISFGTGFVQGFAIILFIGVSLSMFTAVVLVRSFLRAVANEQLEKYNWLIGA